MIKNDGGGGGGAIFGFYRGTQLLRGGHRAHGRGPPTRKNPGKYDLQMLSLCYNPNTIYIYIYILLSENITKHKSK